MYPAKLDRCCSPRRRVLRPITVTLIGACISEASVSPALVQCKFQHGNVFVCVRQRTLVSSLLSHVRPKRRRRAGPPGHARKLHATRSPLSPGLRITSHRSRYYSSAVFKKSVETKKSAPFDSADFWKNRCKIRWKSAKIYLIQNLNSKIPNRPNSPINRPNGQWNRPEQWIQSNTFEWI
jgi:hypothetical protein